MAATYFHFFLILATQAAQSWQISITFKDRYLAGHNFAVDFPKDWLKCSLTCEKNPRCVSYNFHLRSGSCELNDHGLLKDFKAREQLTEGKNFIFHQIRPTFKDILPQRRFIENQCDCNCVSESACTPNPDVNDKFLPVSCKDIYQNHRKTSGAYDLRGDDVLGKFRLYCEMNNILGCGGEGWTLVMKIKGSESTFAYNSSLWTNKAAFHPENGQDLSEQETKLPSYWLTPLTKLCLGMKNGEHTSWIHINQSGTSLYDVIEDGKFKKGNLPTSSWKSLLTNSSIETGCVREGFNVKTNTYYPGSARARIGIIGFQRNCSSTARSRIGYGTSGALYNMDDSNSCGNEDGPSKKSIKAFGYVFVQ